MRMWLEFSTWAKEPFRPKSFWIRKHILIIHDGPEDAEDLGTLGDEECLLGLLVGDVEVSNSRVWNGKWNDVRHPLQLVNEGFGIRALRPLLIP